MAISKNSKIIFKISDENIKDMNEVFNNFMYSFFNQFKEHLTEENNIQNSSTIKSMKSSFISDIKSMQLSYRSNMSENNNSSLTQKELKKVFLPALSENVKKIR